MEKISSIVSKDEKEIIKEIKGVYFDRLEFRIKLPISNEGKLPMEYASPCIQGLKNLNLYAACAEQDANHTNPPYRPKCLNWYRRNSDGFVLPEDSQAASAALQAASYAGIAADFTAERYGTQTINIAALCGAATTSSQKENTVPPLQSRRKR